MYMISIGMRFAARNPDAHSESDIAEYVRSFLWDAHDGDPYTDLDFTVRCTVTEGEDEGDEQTATITVYAQGTVSSGTSADDLAREIQDTALGLEELIEDVSVEGEATVHMEHAAGVTAAPATWYAQRRAG